MVMGWLVVSGDYALLRSRVKKVRGVSLDVKIPLGWIWIRAPSLYLCLNLAFVDCS
jgi:hypothetical protein